MFFFLVLLFRIKGEVSVSPWKWLNCAGAGTTYRQKHLKMVLLTWRNTHVLFSFQAMQLNHSRIIPCRKIMMWFLCCHGNTNVLSNRIIPTYCSRSKQWSFLTKPELFPTGKSCGSFAVMEFIAVILVKLQAPGVCSKVQKSSLTPIFTSKYTFSDILEDGGQPSWVPSSFATALHTQRHNQQKWHCLAHFRSCLRWCQSVSQSGFILFKCNSMDRCTRL